MINEIIPSGLNKQEVTALISEAMSENGGYTKTETLSDSTKSMFGLGETAVPDDALGILSRLHSGLGNEYLWEKKTPIYTTSIATGTTDFLFAVPRDVTIGSSVSCDASGKIVINNATTTTLTKDIVTNTENFFTGKYLRFYGDSRVFKANSNAIAGANSSYYVQCFLVSAVRSGYELVGYTNGSAPTAYPPAESDGFTYNGLGKLGALLAGGAKIETGSYTGTGKAVDVILNFGFTPKYVIIQGYSSSQIYSNTFIHSQLYGLSLYIASGQINNSAIWKCPVSWDVNAMRIQGTSNSALSSFNTQNVKYNYVAIS